MQPVPPSRRHHAPRIRIFKARITQVAPFSNFPEAFFKQLRSCGRTLAVRQRSGKIERAIASAHRFTQVHASRKTSEKLMSLTRRNSKSNFTARSNGMIFAECPDSGH